MFEDDHTATDHRLVLIFVGAAAVADRIRRFGGDSRVGRWGRILHRNTFGGVNMQIIAK